MTATIEPPTYTLLAFDPLACTAVLGDHNGVVQTLAWLRPWHWQLHQQRYWPQPVTEVDSHHLALASLQVQTVQVGLTPATVQVAYSPAERKWYRVTETGAPTEGDPATATTGEVVTLPQPPKETGRIGSVTEPVYVHESPPPEPAIIHDLRVRETGERITLTPIPESVVGWGDGTPEPAHDAEVMKDTPSERKPPLTRQAWSPERRAAASAAAKAKVAALKNAQAQKEEPA